MRSLSGVLMAALGRRLLSQNGWQVEGDSTRDGVGMMEYRLLPGAPVPRCAAGFRARRWRP
ncbi:hypothetical protein GTR05_004578 [Salmonella enterica]|nr:hypothetical protein [Salmonella enterica]